MREDENLPDLLLTHYYAKKPGSIPKELEFLVTKDGTKFMHSRHSVRFGFYADEIEGMERVTAFPRPAPISSSERLYLYPDGTMWIEHKYARGADPNRRNILTELKEYSRPTVTTTEQQQNI